MNKSMRKKILRTVLDFVAAISFVIAIFSTFSHAFITNVNEYRSSIITEEFDSTTMAEYKKCVESINSIVAIDTQKVLSAVSANEIETFEHNYVITVVSSLISGKEMQTEHFSSEKLHTVIYEEIEKYCNENKLEFNANEAEEIYQYICGYIDSTLEFIPNAILPYLKKASPIFSKLVFFGRLQLPLYFIALTVFILNLSIGKKRHVKDVLFGSVSAAWMAFCTITPPICMLALYNIPSKLVLSKNLFFYFVEGVCDILINKLAILLLIVFAIITVMMVIVIILASRQKKKEYSLRAHISENGEILNEIYVEKIVDKLCKQ